MIESCSIAGPGFVNVKLSRQWIAKSIQKMLIKGIETWSPKLQVKRAVVHFSPPNIAKEMHVGHLRSIIIGDMLGRMLEFSNVKVLRRNHVGDWGTQDKEDILEEPLDAKNPNLSSDDISDEDIVESDVEVDNTDIVDPDYDPPQKMGDHSIEVTEENRDAAQISKSQAMDSISGGKLQEAIGHLTEAIMLNPSSAILYATRASVYAKLNKPNAAMRDADAALQINPDSAKGFKVRGMARTMLGQWEEAASDLRVASKLDYDEEIGVALKKVSPNAHKIEEHRRKYERLRKERELRKIERERQRRHAEAKGQEAVSALKDGQVIGIPSAGELEKMLNAASRSSRLAVLYFTATWCGPCRMISPLYTSLAAKYPKVVFLKVDIDEARDAAARWNVSSVPTFFFIRNGKEIDKVVGADKGSLEKKISLYAGQP